MRHHEPQNRAQRRAAARAERRLVKVAGKVGVKTRFVVIDSEGRDVTAERIKPREEATSDS